MIKPGTKIRREPAKFHVVAIGNELLNGEVRDSNLSWLIKWLTTRGGNVVRGAIIPDDFKAIEWEINNAKDQKADALIMTGGLGPTDDDATLEAIAVGLGVPLKLDDQAYVMIVDRISALAVHGKRTPSKMTTERKSQALIPDGATVIFNPVGVAPGIIYDLGGTQLVALPGVPIEMKGIVTGPLKKFFTSLLKGSVYVRKNLDIYGIPEAELAPYIREANRVDPEVYIKSRLKLTGPLAETVEDTAPVLLPWKIILHFSITDVSRKSGEERIAKLIDIIYDEINIKYKFPFHLG